MHQAVYLYLLKRGGKTYLKYSASDYSGAYNLANLTDTQSTTLAYELMKNLNVLSNVFSDKLYNELFNGKSSSGGARLGF